MDEELKKRLDMLEKYSESMALYLSSIKKMLTFFVVLSIVVIVIQVLSVLFGFGEVQNGAVSLWTLIR